VALGTSGTTGASRSVLRSCASWADSFGHVSVLTGIDSGSRVWVPGPLSATMNLFAAVHARATGAEVITRPVDATHAVLTPTALRQCVADVDLRGVVLVVAGDRLPRALADQAVEAGASVAHYYGAAELSFVAWGRDEDDLTPFPGAEVEVRRGEIWVRSPYLCQGYAGEPGALRRDAAGFATVGDRGGFAGGRLRVLGRDGVVVTAGATVVLAEVESWLRACCRGEVAVLGLPHALHGAVLAAVLTEATDHPRAVAESRRMPPAQRPRLWFQMPRLPNNGAGKVDRAALSAAVSSPRAQRLV
jgi:acyl-CoA synthetase (AMP-forming)/AMP-acid ligase II